MPKKTRKGPRKPRTPAPKPLNVATPCSVLQLWNQEKAAAYLQVGTRFLRNSNCPRIHLPGNGEQGEPLLRYKPEQVIEWAESWGTSTVSKTRAA